jgi:hypothetical protein
MGQSIPTYPMWQNNLLKYPIGFSSSFLACRTVEGVVAGLF